MLKFPTKTINALKNRIEAYPIEGSVNHALEVMPYKHLTG